MEIKQDVTVYENTNLYNFDNNILLREYPKRIVELVGGAENAKQMSLLELGVGHGYSTNTFAEYFVDHTVIDADKELIEKFKKTYPGLDIYFENTYFESFQTELKYDIIVMGFILEHVDDPIAVMKKYISCLKENGRMFLAVPNAESLHRRFAHLAGLLPDMRALSETDIRFGHQRYYTADSLKEDIRSAGLELIRMEGIWMKPFTTSQIVSLQLDSVIIEGMCKAAYDYPELSCGLLAEVSDR